MGGEWVEGWGGVEGEGGGGAENITWTACS